MRKNALSDWFEGMRNTIKNDVKEVAEEYHAKLQKSRIGSFFSIPRQVFCFIDYFGLIAYGIASSTDRSVKFIKDHFPSKYHDYPDLIYFMWRHGLIHEYRPKELIIENTRSSPIKIRVKWSSNNDNLGETRAEHLKFFPQINRRATLWLNINNCQFVDDLIASLDNFETFLKTNPRMATKCRRRLKDSRKYLKVEKNHRGGRFTRTIKRKPNRVYDQIVLAWENRSKFKMDSKGNIIKT